MVVYFVKEVVCIYNLVLHVSGSTRHIEVVTAIHTSLDRNVGKTLGVCSLAAMLSTFDCYIAALEILLNSRCWDGIPIVSLQFLS